MLWRQRVACRQTCKEGPELGRAGFRVRQINWKLTHVWKGISPRGKGGREDSVTGDSVRRLPAGNLKDSCAHGWVPPKNGTARRVQLGLARPGNASSVNAPLWLTSSTIALPAAVCFWPGTSSDGWLAAAGAFYFLRLWENSSSPWAELCLPRTFTHQFWFFPVPWDHTVCRFHYHPRDSSLDIFGDHHLTMRHLVWLSMSTALALSCGMWFQVPTSSAH